MILIVVFTIISSIVTHRYYLKRRTEAQERRKMMQSSEPTSLQIKLDLIKKKGSALYPDNRAVRSFCERFVKCFSIQQNLRKLFSDHRYDKEEPEFEIFNAMKVYSIAIIVLGNTYYYILSGPLQNLEVVYEWVYSSFFYFILQADLQSSCFYFITGFTLSFTMLKKHKQNDGNFWANPVRIFFERYLRLLPLYVFMLLFLWLFMSTTGGYGPMFYQYEEGHGCKEYFVLHVFMLNNIWPWGDKDYCIHQSWYLANDIWFSIPCITQVHNF